MKLIVSEKVSYEDPEEGETSLLDSETNQFHQRRVWHRAFLPRIVINAITVVQVATMLFHIVVNSDTGDRRQGT